MKKTVPFSMLLLPFSFHDEKYQVVTHQLRNRPIARFDKMKAPTKETRYRNSVLSYAMSSGTRGGVALAPVEGQPQM